MSHIFPFSKKKYGTYISLLSYLINIYFVDLPGYKKRFHDDVRLNRAQKKELKKVGTPSRAIKYWPRNDDDGLFYVPYILDKRFTPFEEKTIRLAFKEFPKHTNIR